MSLFHKLKKWMIQEMVEYLPWAFISYVAGILSYFMLGTWLNLYFLLGGCFGTGIILYFVRKKVVISWFMVLSFFFLLGITNIAIHFILHHHPILENSLYQEKNMEHF